MKNIEIHKKPWEYATFEEFFSEDEVVGLLDGIDFIADDPKFHKKIKELYTELGGENAEEYILKSNIKNLGAEGDHWPADAHGIHTDLKPGKMFTAIVYLSEHSKGTYTYSTLEGHDKKEIEWKQNVGYGFIPTKTTYHSQPEQSEWEGVRTIVMYNIMRDTNCNV